MRFESQDFQLNKLFVHIFCCCPWQTLVSVSSLEWKGATKWFFSIFNVSKKNRYWSGM